ncbi:MAG: S8 family serine peptidase [Deltaproteobacteria bacterium]|nr:S8 family serine peptidase [Deltaproteobacteria bacterium]
MSRWVVVVAITVALHGCTTSSGGDAGDAGPEVEVDVAGPEVEVDAAGPEVEVDAAGPEIAADADPEIAADADHETAADTDHAIDSDAGPEVDGDDPEVFPTALAGEPGASAHGAIPRLPYDPSRATFAELTIPGGLEATVDATILLLADDATVADANSVLATLGAEIIGGLPPLAEGAPGLLVLKLPSTTHAQREALEATVDVHPAVRVTSPDARVGSGRAAATADPLSWGWDVQPAGGNWGMEATGARAAWNVIPELHAAGAQSVVGILDGGVPQATHEDLDAIVIARVGSTADHATMVAGIIGAEHDALHPPAARPQGVDGVNPFALVTATTAAGWSPVTTQVETFVTVDLEAFAQLAAGDAALGFPAADVINYSYGYGFCGVNRPNDPCTRPDVTAPAYEQMLTDHTALFVARLGPLPTLVFCAAGNENREIAARYTSACCNAAVAPTSYDRAHCVEAVELVAGDVVPWDGANDPLGGGLGTNVFGTLAAPGASVLTTMPGGYGSAYGTSFATPFLAGLASLLLTVDLDPAASAIQPPTVQDVIDVLRHPDALRPPPLGSDAAPWPHVYDALLTLDVVTGETGVARLLTDLDDGTPDGNLRADANGTGVLTESDGLGDGRVDISDFRRFRDWLLQAEGHALDGATDHPKKDLDGDGAVRDGASENVWPRGDLNGDGQLSRTAVRDLPGGRMAYTDLDLLKELYDDPRYPVAQLDQLIDSLDLHAHLGDCLDESGVVRAEAVFVVDGVELARLPLDATAPEEILTVSTAASEVVVRVEGLDAGGALVSQTAARALALLPGADIHVSGCRGGVDLAVCVGDYSDSPCDEGSTLVEDTTSAFAARFDGERMRTASARFTTRGLCLELACEDHGDTGYAFTEAYARLDAEAAAALTTARLEVSVVAEPATDAMAYVELWFVDEGDTARSGSVDFWEDGHGEAEWRAYGLWTEPEATARAVELPLTGEDVGLVGPLMLGANAYCAPDHLFQTDINYSGAGTFRVEVPPGACGP